MSVLDKNLDFFSSISEINFKDIENHHKNDAVSFLKYLTKFPYRVLTIHCSSDSSMLLSDQEFINFKESLGQVIHKNEDPNRK